MTSRPIRVVVLISGSGSNLQAIIDQTESGALPIEVCAVISNITDAGGLQRAKRHNIPAQVLEHARFESREAFDSALAELIDTHSPNLVVLAGFMRILSAPFVQHYLGRMLNIHPSLLPKFQGLHTHQRALAAGEKKHGATVHFVTEELDGGPKVIQAEVPVKKDDTPDSLSARVLLEEHRIYPTAIRWFAEGRLSMRHGHAWLDEKVL